MDFLIKPFQTINEYRKILAAVTRVEFAKKYSGSALGKLWIVLHPSLLLSMYLFVYAAIFKIQFAGATTIDYVIYVFCGLIPYIGFMEAVTSGCVAIKQNIHLLKNVMFPIELIPVRYVLMSIVTQLISLGLLLILVVLNGSLTWQIIGLPLAVVLQTMLLIGLLWFLAPLGVTLPDTSYFVNLAVLFLMFISPIGFRPDMVPAVLRFTLYLNPIYYMTEVYRGTLIHGHRLAVSDLIVYALLSIVVFFAGSVFFTKFKTVLIDYE